MRALLQRVSEASVTVDAEIVGAIDSGLLVFLGVFPDDSEAELEWMADKILGLRIFADDEKAMNRSVVDVDGGVLVVSQFTLAADVSRGKRPGFSTAAVPSTTRSIPALSNSSIVFSWRMPPPSWVGMSMAPTISLMMSRLSISPEAAPSRSTM